uniref:Cell cycle control protein n=1 Tax=Sinocyclocheilus grahami TaxID=75366 RepID=A0A672MNZ4_SINGR
MKNEGEAAKRPDNTAFTQQRLPAWQPILSAGIVIPSFLLIGLAFIGIGIGLFLTSQTIQVWEMDYTGFEKDSPCFRCTILSNQNCTCEVTFSLSTLFSVKSSYFPSDCSPYAYDSEKNPIVPCGAIANSIFNDTFELYQIINGTKKQVPLDGKGISWWTDYNIKYRNPSSVNSSFAKSFDGTVKPINWPKPAYELDLTDPNNNGFLNQDFLVWMRRAALPQFRKLYRRITDGDYAAGLPAGNYSLKVHYNYPVLSFDGRKKVVFSNVSWMGGKNDFLGIAYLVVGSLCVVMSVVMLVVYAKFKFSDDDDDA